jgi:hypothetical protein
MGFHKGKGIVTPGPNTGRNLDNLPGQNKKKKKTE